MLTIINEDLYAFNCVKGIDPRTKLDSYRISVATSNKLLHYRNTQDQSQRRKIQNGVENHNPPPESTPREILTIQTPSDDLNAYQKLPISLRVGENQKGNPTVAVRCLGETDTNNANVYVLAIPFNGMINPIPEDPKYHIYKGLIGSSVRPFFFNGRRYKKILYLVIEPHMKLFAPDHKYHTDQIDIRVDTYAIVNDKETGKDYTNHETYTFSVVSADGMYRDKWEYERLEEPVYISDDTTAQPVWHTFKFIQKDRDSKPYSAKKKASNGRREGYVSGNTYVTTNKHGIRKEIPLRNRDEHTGGSPNGRREKFNRKNGTDNDFERMLQESGLYDEHEDRRNAFNRKKGNRGKGNRNGRHDH